MDLEAPIAEGLFIKRLNRFLGIVNIKGEYFYAHIHDPGRLEDLLKPGVRVYLRQGRGKYPLLHLCRRSIRRPNFNRFRVAFQDSGVADIKRLRSKWLRNN